MTALGFYLNFWSFFYKHVFHPVVSVLIRYDKYKYKSDHKRHDRNDRDKSATSYSSATHSLVSSPASSKVNISTSSSSSSVLPSSQETTSSQMTVSSGELFVPQGSKRPSSSKKPHKIAKKPRISQSSDILGDILKGMDKQS